MFELLVNIVSLNTFSSVNKMLEVVEKDWVAEVHISIQKPRYSAPVSLLHAPGSLSWRLEPKSSCNHFSCRKMEPLLLSHIGSGAVYCLCTVLVR